MNEQSAKLFRDFSLNLNESDYNFISFSAYIVAWSIRLDFVHFETVIFPSQANTYLTRVRFSKLDFCDAKTL